MIDKRMVEGSSERAADRGNDFGFNLVSRPSLGDTDVAHKLLSQFGTDIVNTRLRYHQDQLNSEQAQAQVRTLAKYYGNIVMGRDNHYEVLPWHSPDRLGRRITLVVAPVEDITDAGELLFLTLGTSLMALAAANETGRVSDAEAEMHTKEILEDAANLVLGLR